MSDVTISIHADIPIEDLIDSIGLAIGTDYDKMLEFIMALADDVNDIDFTDSLIEALEKSR